MAYALKVTEKYGRNWCIYPFDEPEEWRPNIWKGNNRHFHYMMARSCVLAVQSVYTSSDDGFL